MIFQHALQSGKVGENAIARWLMKKGYAVLPAYELQLNSGKGPRLFTAERQYIAPDLLAFSATQTIWVEAKHKTAFTWHRLTSVFVTGIDLRHYQDYLAIEDRGPWPVTLLFLHEGGIAKDSPISPSGLFGQRLSYLRHHEHHRHENWGRTGMVYWELATLILLSPMESLAGGD